MGQRSTRAQRLTEKKGPPGLSLPLPSGPTGDGLNRWSSALQHPVPPHPLSQTSFSLSCGSCLGAGKGGAISHGSESPLLA